MKRAESEKRVFEILASQACSTLPKHTPLSRSIESSVYFDAFLLFLSKKLCFYVSLALCHCFFHSLSPYTLSLTHSHSHTLTHTLSLTHSHSHTLTHTLSLTHSHSHKRTLSHSLSLSLSLSLLYSLLYSLCPCLSLSLLVFSLSQRLNVSLSLSLCTFICIFRLFSFPF
jgi:ABC-type nickel/cobalt efflux system permease component RcnA